MVSARYGSKRRRLGFNGCSVFAPFGRPFATGKSVFNLFNIFLPIEIYRANISYGLYITSHETHFYRVRGNIKSFRNFRYWYAFHSVKYKRVKIWNARYINFNLPLKGTGKKPEGDIRMSGLLQVVERNEQQVVHARDLYAALEVRRDFSTWIKDRVEKYGFMEGEDFSPDLGKNIGGRRPLVGMAKDTIQVATDMEE